MPQTLEIIIGDTKQVSEELARRTVQEINKSRKAGVHKNGCT